MKYKYPIGTRIKYKGCVCQDVGKEGTIVGYVSEEVIWVVVPKSIVALSTHQDSEHRWTTYLTSVEVLATKNEQLLFNFMY